MKQTLLLIFLIFLLISIKLSACSIFSFNSNSRNIVAKDYDWMFDHGYLTVNKRDVSKESLIIEDKLPGSEKLISAKWTSKFGSVTFNQYGHEFPVGGMNEAGLTVEALVLPETKIEKNSHLPSVNELQWVQFQLDNYETVREVAENINNLYIHTQVEGLHYFVCDRSGECLAVEFLENSPVTTHRFNNLSYKLLTNSTYDDSVKFLKEHDGFGGTRPLPTTESSLNRFVLVANELKSTPTDKIENWSFNVLDKVFVPTDPYKTRWQIVYDMTNLTIRFKVGKSWRRRKISLNKLDFRCQTPVKTFNLKSWSRKYDISSKLRKFSPFKNKISIYKSLKDKKGDFSKDSMKKILNYYSTTKCNSQ